jgi:hypothetical protein
MLGLFIQTQRHKEEIMAENPTTTLPGTVQKIIQSPDPSIPEKAEIAVEGADELYREIRIENTLTDEKGHEVKLKSGAEVEVTIAADPEATVPKDDLDGGSSSNGKPESPKAKGTGKS